MFSLLTKASKQIFFQHLTANKDNLLFIFKRKTIFVKRKFRHGVHVHVLHCAMPTQVNDSASGFVGRGTSKREL